MPWTATIRLVGSRGDYLLDEERHLTIVAEWWAYGDETGTHDGSKYCAVLGYIASPRQWKSFRRDWREALGKKIPEFHAKDFFQRASWQSSDSPYHGWSGRKAEAFLDKLLRTINRYDIRPIGFAYEVEPFMALSLEKRKRLTGAVRHNRIRRHGDQVEVGSRLISSGAPTQLYFLGFSYLITEAIKAAPPGAKVSFVFDRRKQSEARAADMFEEIIRFSDSPALQGRLGLLSYGDSADYEPLQAADHYNYMINRALQGTVDDLMLRAVEKLTKKKDSIGIANADLYQKLIEHQDLNQAEFFRKAIGVQA